MKPLAVGEVRKDTNDHTVFLAVVPKDLAERIRNNPGAPPHVKRERMEQLGIQLHDKITVKRRPSNATSC